MAINNKRSVTTMIAVLSLTLVFLLFTGCEKMEEPMILHKEIAADEIIKVSMSEWVYGGSRVQQANVDLNQTEINQLRSLFNSVPEDRVKEVQIVNPNLIAGIVFDLKSNAEVRVQYDKKDVYVTRTDKTGQKKYVVEYPELKNFFDNKLK
jgi:hypothetical protein